MTNFIKFEGVALDLSKCSAAVQRQYREAEARGEAAIRANSPALAAAALLDIDAAKAVVAGELAADTLIKRAHANPGRLMPDGSVLEGNLNKLAGDRPQLRK